ncbi:ATP-dependent DNA helicase RecG [Salisediminibacterium halotolerans]|uniref:ATP-dependent DNA helicase RecG n=1 Tax=Salisediminibacterium halotolerans TaxID=517425 RepID=UPI000F121F12|nr:ATP-dependent DNA helicase RecG [Salisediminibacterium halotolerans]RLJ74262.1 ATP-dependent DNA helicase RecG [Actinophytocola xinjiangensis]RPE87646.1 ATP-dependent DNA helicase RecG [Salisediminibacterium halotolerans]TWG35099.1 ATP-dependent DNA helicase RecG [Salisediminibacterium halotolerans]GEL06853.1 ATP-dependent DNA helicase RecG [Salisediminibacterium halotolerans]
MNDPVTVLSGVGPKTAEQLEQMGIRTVADLLAHFPFRYENNEIRPLTDAEHGEQVTIQGDVHSEPELRFFGKKKSRLTVRVLVDGLLVKAVFFNQPYVKKQIALGDHIVLSGKLDRHRLMVNGAVLKPASKLEQGGLEPVYSLKGELKQRTLKKLIEEAFAFAEGRIAEILPESFLKQYKLMPRAEAFFYMHFPKDETAFQQAKRRMVYEELLLFQLKMQWFRQQERQADEGIMKSWDKQALRSFTAGLGISLTGAQKRVLQEILDDMRGRERMNRLLQGDVGSGKTIVAAVALYASVLSGFQGALMVPTEILAEQHAVSLKELFAGTGVTVVHLSGSSPAKKRRETLEQLKEGAADIIVGTHALIQEGVDFANLGLVITDEQHRFGVNQRRVLREKGLHPDVLFMTATPIPRTLAITAFGDMDVSTIDELPEGRKPIKTHWGKRNMLPRVLDFIKREAEAGKQAYVICPLIEESEMLDVQNAIDLHSSIESALPELTVGLMHGRLHHEEKETIMTQFQANALQVLVSTTVVEVGVNVPNATVMVIYDADRFGLAQLHQLRGRVGRGADQSHCVLLADPKTEVGKERMSIMTETADGFELSQRDLELRGPGEFFGVKQSGLPRFKVAALVEDYRTLETARADAAKLVESGSLWQAASCRKLFEQLAAEGLFNNERVD